MNQAVRRGLSVCEREILRQQREKERERETGRVCYRRRRERYIWRQHRKKERDRKNVGRE